MILHKFSTWIVISAKWVSIVSQQADYVHSLCSHDNSPDTHGNNVIWQIFCRLFFCVHFVRDVIYLPLTERMRAHKFIGKQTWTLNMCIIILNNVNNLHFIHGRRQIMNESSRSLSSEATIMLLPHIIEVHHSFQHFDGIVQNLKLFRDYCSKWFHARHIWQDEKWFNRLGTDLNGDYFRLTWDLKTFRSKIWK